MYLNFSLELSLCQPIHVCPLPFQLSCVAVSRPRHFSEFDVNRASIKWANLNVCNSVEMLSITTSQCKMQTADYCFHHENETTIVPLFSNPKNNSLQSVRSLPHITTADIHVPTFLNSPDGNPGFSK